MAVKELADCPERSNRTTK